MVWYDFGFVCRCVRCGAYVPRAQKGRQENFDFAKTMTPTEIAYAQLKLKPTTTGRTTHMDTHTHRQTSDICTVRSTTRTTLGPEE